MRRFWNTYDLKGFNLSITLNSLLLIFLLSFFLWMLLFILELLFLFAAFVEFFLCCFDCDSSDLLLIFLFHFLLLIILINLLLFLRYSKLTLATHLAILVHHTVDTTVFHRLWVVNMLRRELAIGLKKHLNEQKCHAYSNY